MVLLAGASACSSSDLHAGRAPALRRPDRALLRPRPSVTLPASVVERFPELSVDDALDLDRVDRVFSHLDPSQFVHVDGDDSEPTVLVSPRGESAAALAFPLPARQPSVFEHGSGMGNVAGDRCDPTSALTRFGALVTLQVGEGFVDLDLARCGPVLHVHDVRHLSGIVWSYAKETALLLAFDGTRHTVPRIQLARGIAAAVPSEEAGAAAEARQPMHNAFISLAEIRWLSTKAIRPPPSATDVAEAHDAWRACSEPLWRGAQRAYEENDQRIAPARIKECRSDIITRAFGARVDRECRSDRNRFEFAAARVFEERAHDLRELESRNHRRYASL